MTRLVEATWKAIAAVKSAPLRKQRPGQCDGGVGAGRGCRAQDGGGGQAFRPVVGQETRDGRLGYQHLDDRRQGEAQDQRPGDLPGHRPGDTQRVQHAVPDGVHSLVAGWRSAGWKRRSRSELVTTNTELDAIAAPAMSGESRPRAATGISTML